MGMPSERRTIQRTLLTMGGRNGEIFSLLIFRDGGYGIARNNEPLDGLYWRDDALDDCLSKLLWLAGKSERFGR
jgi:hypothetical protein